MGGPGAATRRWPRAALDLIAKIGGGGA